MFGVRIPVRDYSFGRIFFLLLTIISMFVQSKGNNTRLGQASEKIYDDGNLYFIIIDCALDNPDVLRELKQLHNGIKGKKNVKVIKIPSFEYALLSI